MTDTDATRRTPLTIMVTVGLPSVSIMLPDFFSRFRKMENIAQRAVLFSGNLRWGILMEPPILSQTLSIDCSEYFVCLHAVYSK